MDLIVYNPDIYKYMNEDIHIIKEICIFYLTLNTNSEESELITKPVRDLYFKYLFHIHEKLTTRINDLGIEDRINDLGIEDRINDLGIKLVKQLIRTICSELFERLVFQKLYFYQRGLRSYYDDILKNENISHNNNFVNTCKQIKFNCIYHCYTYNETAFIDSELEQMKEDHESIEKDVLNIHPNSEWLKERIQRIIVHSYNQKQLQERYLEQLYSNLEEFKKIYTEELEKHNNQMIDIDNNFKNITDENLKINFIKFSEQNTLSPSISESKSEQNTLSPSKSEPILKILTSIYTKYPKLFQDKPINMIRLILFKQQPDESETPDNIYNSIRKLDSNQQNTLFGILYLLRYKSPESVYFKQVSEYINEKINNNEYINQFKKIGKQLWLLDNFPAENQQSKSRFRWFKPMKEIILTNDPIENNFIHEFLNKLFHLNNESYTSYRLQTCKKLMNTLRIH